MANTTTKLNERQVKFLEVLKNADKPLTLAKINEIAKEDADYKGGEIKTGSINSLLENGKNLAKCNKNAEEIVCACCGHKTKVSTYELI